MLIPWDFRVKALAAADDDDDDDEMLFRLRELKPPLGGRRNGSAGPREFFKAVKLVCVYEGKEDLPVAALFTLTMMIHHHLI